MYSVSHVNDNLSAKPSKGHAGPRQLKQTAAAHGAGPQEEVALATQRRSTICVCECICRWSRPRAMGLFFLHKKE